MVKYFVLLLLNIHLLFAQIEIVDISQEIDNKIYSLIGEEQYQKNENFIHILFEQSSDYVIKDRLDVVKIVDTLKENGLLKLFFDKPRRLNLTFTTNGNSLYFVKLMAESLRSMGYYRYITNNSKLDERGFHWQISLTTEYVTDPILLREALAKQHCEIVDINRSAEDSWNYVIDMSRAHLDLKVMIDKKSIALKRAHNAHWLDVSKTKKLTIYSKGRNNWFPNIAFYDPTMHLLKVYKRDKKTWKITFKLPKECMYIKIDDLYSLKNIREGLNVTANGVK